MSFATDLDVPLLKLSASDSFTLRDACNGVHIFGGIGSGKTSGSGQTLAGAYLRSGMGGLVLCAKPEEVDLWLTYAKLHGRSNSVIVFDENEGFNFITYELARQKADGISNVIALLMRVIEAAKHATGEVGKASDEFWQDSTRQMLQYTVPIIYAAHGVVTVRDVIEFVSSAATTAKQFNDADWEERSYAAQTFKKAANRVEDKQLIGSWGNYWFRQFISIPEKTRGNILISLTTSLDRFTHGRLSRAFCGKTTIVPEMTFHGAIIIMKMPVLTWNDDGIIGQQLFKLMWQRAVESRNGLEPAQRERPVFLWADEAQYFVSVKDDEFLSTCRGSRACVVFLTQTLPTYYARLGKERSDAADGLVGKFTTQVFHQNACSRTNKFASELIGRGIQYRATSGTSTGGSVGVGVNSGGQASDGYSSGGGSSGSWSPQGGSDSFSRNWGNNSSSGESWGTNRSRQSSYGSSHSVAEHLDNLIEPNFFANGLKSGGPSHKHEVSAVWFKAGGNFKAADGLNFLTPTFKQVKQ